MNLDTKDKFFVINCLVNFLLNQHAAVCSVQTVEELQNEQQYMAYLANFVNVIIRRFENDIDLTNDEREALAAILAVQVEGLGKAPEIGNNALQALLERLQAIVEEVRPLLIV